MNYLLAREGAEGHEGKTCFYCNKVFSNCRALGGHLRIHQEEKTLVTLNESGRSSNYMDTNRNLPASLPISQQSPLAGGNNPTLTRAPVVVDLPWMFYTSETDPASTSRFAGTNPRVAQTQIIVVSPDLPYGCGNGATYHHNSSAPGGFAPAGANAAMASSALAPSGSAVAAGFPPDSSLYLGSNGVQFNTDGFQIYRDGFRPSSGDAFQNVQGVNLGPPLSSSLENFGQYERRTMISEGKRTNLADESGNAGLMNAPKRPKVSPSVIVEPKRPETKELLHIFDAGDSVSASKTRSGAEEEGPEDLDLSLHL